MSSSDTADPSILILGIGNLLWADEGFGVRAIEALNARYEFPDNVTLMDGGTQGIYLIQHVQAADTLIVFDAIDYGLPPGTLKLIRDEDVPKFMGAKKMSLHQTGFQEVLSTAELLGSCPKNILLIGVQPEELEDYGGSLRPSVKACMEPALDHALAYCKEIGVSFKLRADPLPADRRLAAPETDIDSYESERPDIETACRSGDERILRDQKYTFDPKQMDPDESLVSVSLDQRGKN